MVSELGYKNRVILCALVAAALFLLIMLDGSLIQLLKLDTENGRFAVRLGHWMGHGSIQVPFLVLMILFGGFAESRRLLNAGKYGLAAFIASGIGVQILKHIVGRPRPRLYLEGVREIGPSFADGFDSFPSGHTATSMAVAVVLSYYFPKWSPVIFGAAAFVSASRMLGGSHFPTDILGGAVLGLIVGFAVVKFAPVHEG